MAKKVALVACVGRKTNMAMPAAHLYRSDWFLKASAYARAVADCWFILSAKYGLIAPDQIIAPYDETLKTKSAADRRAWSRGVVASLRGVLRSGDTVIVLAGEMYRRGLVNAVREMGCTVEIPMTGLRIGEQLSWLNRRLGEIGASHKT